MRYYTFLFMMFYCLQSTLIVDAKPPNTALIIGISHYQKHDDSKMRWKSINAREDVKLMKATLMARGFKEEDIIILEDETATKENILNTIHEKWVDISKKGSSCILHFSGHGQQVFDDNKDEADGLDEAIVPYDAGQKYKEGTYHGEKHIRDDELNSALDKLRKKIGSKGEILILLDACHSGTGVRDGTIVDFRGSKEILASSAYLKTIRDKVMVKASIGLGNDKTKQAKIITFSASSSHELNYQTYNDQGKACGSLSLAFSKAFVRADISTTYGELFSDIQCLMNSFVPNQTPLAEGVLSLKILGGGIKKESNYYNIKSWINSENIVCNMGTLQGMTSGATVKIHVPIKNNTKNNILKGTVVYSNLTSSEIKLNDGVISKEQSRLAKVFVKEKNYFYSIPLCIKETIQRSVKEYIQFKINKSNSFEEVVSEEYISIEQNGNGFSIKQNNGVLLKENIKTKENLWRQLEMYYTADFLRKVSSETIKYKTSLEIVETKGEWNDEGDFIFESYINANNIIDTVACHKMKEGTTFRYRIKNESSQTVYYTLILIDSENEINILIPYFENGYFENLTPYDLKIEPNSIIEYEFDFIISGKKGMDVLKLISSSEPLDLRYVSSKGNGHESINYNLFGDMYNQLMNPKEEVEDNTILLPGDIYIKTFMINITR